MFSTGQVFFVFFFFFKDLTRTTASDKILRDKALNIATNPKYEGYQRGLASTVYEFVNKISVFRLQINLLLVVVLKIKIFQTKN